MRLPDSRADFVSGLVGVDNMGDALGDLGDVAVCSEELDRFLVLVLTANEGTAEDDFAAHERPLL